MKRVSGQRGKNSFLHFFFNFCERETQGSKQGANAKLKGEKWPRTWAHSAKPEEVKQQNNVCVKHKAEGTEAT